MDQDRSPESLTGEEATASDGEQTPAAGDGGGDEAGDASEVEYEADGGYGNEASDPGGSSSDATKLPDDSSSEQSRTVDVAVDDPASEQELTQSERAALDRVDKLAHLLDESVRIPGTNVRFGIDPLLGVLPVGGDAVAAALSLYPIAEAYRHDAPRSTIAKMLSLVAVDAIVGSVPVLGVLFDAFWKANVWNARALERHVEGT